MRKILLIVLVGVIVGFYNIQALRAEKNKNASEKPIYAVVGGKDKTTPFPTDERTGRILKRSEIEREAYNLGKQGMYEDALDRYRQAIDPSLLNSEYDKSTALWAMRDIHQRQGKFDLALKEHEWFISANATKMEYLDKKRELTALINARDTSSNQPIYDHIAFLRDEYRKYIPPQSQGDSGFHTAPINDIIHLYDWIGDFDGGIKFMQEVLSSRTLYPEERKEYDRVKNAFEDGKRTGQKGHLKKVIETSNYIGW